MQQAKYARFEEYQVWQVKYARFEEFKYGITLNMTH
jgi:hypothetical protein